MRLNTLKPAAGSKSNRKRVGRVHDGAGQAWRRRPRLGVDGSQRGEVALLQLPGGDNELLACGLDERGRDVVGLDLGPVEKGLEESDVCCNTVDPELTEGPAGSPHGLSEIATRRTADDLRQ